jgi:hypothetical protein
VIVIGAFKKVFPEMLQSTESNMILIQLKKYQESHKWNRTRLREIGTKIDKSDYSILHHVTSLIYIEL